MKVLFGILLALSLLFFAFMQWGGVLTGANKNGSTLPEMNAAAIKVLESPSIKSMNAVTPQTLPLPTPASAPIAMVAPISEVKTTVSKTCLEWGEFSGIDLGRATKVLAEMKLGDKLTQRAVEYSSGYWVYIKPVKTHAAVNQKIAQIKALGVEDYFVVQEPGKWFNAISLGVFKTHEAAKNYLMSLNRKGVHTAKIGERKRRLKFTVFVLKDIDVNSRTQLTTQHKFFPGSELSIIACK